MYTYTAEHLKEKTFSELKSIARDMALVPLGDRRCRQNWVNVIIGAPLPLLKLLDLEVSPVVEVEPVVKPIKIQAEPIELAQKSLTQLKSIAKNLRLPFGGLRKKSDLKNLILWAYRVDDPAYVAAGDARDAAVRIQAEIEAGDWEHQEATDPSDSDVQFSSSIELAAETPLNKGDSESIPTRTATATVEVEIESVDEPPDPDDFESLNAFREAIALWEAQHPEPLEICLDSFCEWAPCPDDWYEPAPSEVLELSPAIESSSTCKFLIPIFKVWCRDRQNDTDEPPDRGIFARLPKPKPPSFPPMSVVVGDRANRIKKFGRSARLLSGRSPPGGDELI